MNMELTERGRQAPRKPDGLRAELLLYLEVLARIGGSGDDSNVNAMVDELIDRFGGAEGALVAVKVGHVGFEGQTNQQRREHDHELIRH